MKLNTLIRSAISFAFCAVAEAAPKKPNILFIAVDDLRPELGCYGKDYIKSPNIDRIARAGIVFKRAYCQQAICSPSRTSLMTGTRPDTTKVWDLVTHFRKNTPDVVTLGQHFKNNGYFVKGIGKIYHGSLSDDPTWSVPLKTPDAPKYALPENVKLDQSSKKAGSNGDAASKSKKKKPIDEVTSEGLSANKYNSRGPAFEAADVPDHTFQDGKVAELAVANLSEMSKKDQPFFLAVGFIKPHLPFVSPKKYWDLYDPATIQLAPNNFYPKDAPKYAIRNYANEVRSYDGIPAETIPDDLARQLKHGYYASISYTDAQVGKLLDELERLGIRDNTIVILWGDHGWKLGEHSGWAKHSNSENDTNAPLILSAPGMKKPGITTDALVEFVDIYPSLADMAGLSLPPHLEGASFKPLLDEPKSPWKSAAFSQYPRDELMGYSMRTEKYRFTVWVDRTDHTKVDATELYDHDADPQENTNIANEPANAALVAQLMQQWKKGWQGAKPTAGH
jgi:iduronate 2-sulfatase